MTPQPLVLCLLLLAPAEAKADGYPRADLLMEPAELAKPAVALGFRILDSRPRKQYEEGHIPNAVWVDHNEWAKAFAAGQDPKEWAGRIGRLGIRDAGWVGQSGTRDKVVVYGGPMNDPARIRWILRYWGVKDVRILNGGWKAWTAGGYPVSTRRLAALPAPFTATPRANRLATKEQILQGLKKGPPQIVDARSEGEHCGTVALAKRGGSIPGSINLEWTELLDKKTGRFKSAAELRRLFRQAGISLDRPTVTYCQSGGRAAVMAFALELMGARDVRNYYRSWAEWGNAEDTPVERPKR